MDSQAKRIAEMLKVLANENRLQILCELIEGPKTVGTLGEKINGITQSALSQHLALLKAHGMLEDHKSGQYVTYFVADRHVAELIAMLKRSYCDTGA